MSMSRGSVDSHCTHTHVPCTHTCTLTHTTTAHLQETLDELVPLRMRFEADKQRKAIGMEPVGNPG